MIIDHRGLAVGDDGRRKKICHVAPGPLGIEFVMEAQGRAGFGADGKPPFCFGKHTPRRPMPIAFAAGSREQVRHFYRAALAAGGTDNGEPGARQVYQPNIFGAFVPGPDGRNIEAVDHPA